MQTFENEIPVGRPISPDEPVDEAERHEIRHLYPAAAFRDPFLTVSDRLALALAAVMLIGPLAVLPLGFGS
ncbi:MAG: hypothetical protein ACOH2J_02075 [Allorhizobium sp.]